MYFKMIGKVNYKKEVKALISKITIKPIIENRGTFFKKQSYYIYISSDGRYSLSFKYKGEFHWGPKFYNLTLETRENGNILIKKDFGNRIFVCGDYYESNYLWAEFCNKFYIWEIEEMSDSKSSNFIKIYDAESNIETLVAENGWDVFVWSKNATHIIYKVYNKDNTIDVALTDLSNKKTTNILKEIKESLYYLYSAFFDKDEKYIIAIERDKHNNGIMLKIFTLPEIKLIYSQGHDFKREIVRPNKFTRFFIEKNKFFDPNNLWFTVKFDKDNNFLYFGFQKEGSLWGEDYYDRLLWLKAKIEF